MTLLHDNPRLGGFRPVHGRTLYAVVQEPQLIRFWSASEILASDDEPPPPAEAFPSLRGVAVLEKDSVALIGANANPARQLSLIVRAVPDWNAHRQGWKEHVTKWGHPLDVMEPSDKELIEYLTASYSRFEKRAATAYLYFSTADWEIGCKDEWGIQLDIPLNVAQDIAQDISAGLCKELSFSFELAACFSDYEYAPPSVGVTIGIPQRGKCGGLASWLG